MKCLVEVTMQALLIMLLPTLVFGQNATLGGTVVDDLGALIPGVAIEAKNNATCVVANATSNQAGGYSLPSLLRGRYIASAEKSEFRHRSCFRRLLPSASIAGHSVLLPTRWEAVRSSLWRATTSNFCRWTRPIHQPVSSE